MKISRGEAIFIIIFFIVTVFAARYYAEISGPIPGSYHQKAMSRAAEGRYNDELEDCKDVAKKFTSSNNVIVWHNNITTGEHYCGLVGIDQLTADKNNNIIVLNSQGPKVTR